MPRYQEPSTWTPDRVKQHVDPILLNDRILNISLEMQPRSLAAKNTAKNPAQWAEAEAKLVDEWAEKTFNAWMEIWDVQGLPRCHALYRAVYESALVPLFAARRSHFQDACQGLDLVKRRPHFHSAAMKWFARHMDNLASNWNRRMEVESRQAMYAARREAATASPPAQIASIAPAVSIPPESEPEKAQLISPSRKMAGRKPKRNPKFVLLARALWKAKQDSSGRVDQAALKEIAARLDASPFSNPSEWLEGKAASKLKEHNKKFGNSPKKIVSWIDVVVKNEPNFKPAMRKLLSRCAGSSGN